MTTFDAFTFWDHLHDPDNAWFHDDTGIPPLAGEIVGLFARLLDSGNILRDGDNLVFCGGAAAILSIEEQRAVRLIEEAIDVADAVAVRGGIDDE